MTLPTIDIWFVAKIMFLIGLGLYAIFAGVVVRQVQLMLDTLEVGLETQIRIASYIHLAVAVGVFILALIIL